MEIKWCSKDVAMKRRTAHTLGLDHGLQSRRLTSDMQHQLLSCLLSCPVCLPAALSQEDKARHHQDKQKKRCRPIPHLLLYAPPHRQPRSSSACIITAPPPACVAHRPSLSLSLSLNLHNIPTDYHPTNSPALTLPPCARLLRRRQRTPISSPTASRCLYSFILTELFQAGHLTHHSPPPLISYPHSLDALRHSPSSRITHTHFRPQTSHTRQTDTP